MFNLDGITNKNNKDDDKNWPYKMLVVGHALLNLMQKQNKDNSIEKIYLHAKDLSKPKY